VQSTFPAPVGNIQVEPRPVGFAAASPGSPVWSPSARSGRRLAPSVGGEGARRGFAQRIEALAQRMEDR